MAAVLTKTGLLKLRRNPPSLNYSFKTRIRLSLPDPGIAAATTNTGKKLRQPKPLARFSRSVLRKTKENDSLCTSTAASRISATSSSFSEKSGFVGWYLTMLNTRPIITKSITSALIYTAADFSSQTFAGEHLEQYDLIRTVRMAGYGMLIIGPSMHYWYNFMFRVFPERDVLSTLKKIVSGQAVFGPSMTILFFSLNAALQGESALEIVARLKRDLLPTMINGLIYWPFCDFVTFRFIPVHLQPLVVNSFAYLWTVYITYVANLGKVGPN